MDGKAGDRAVAFRLAAIQRLAMGLGRHPTSLTSGVPGTP